ncbi:MAG: PDZ domain-containing protein, partial [Clostridia bacterium]|nr:PDZ domain-containing protein [Clostridia bacterium]
GIISGLNRQVSSDSEIGLIQTDAAINPGNSGGALLDSTGKLIGINSSKIVAEEFEGMGFAIPVNTVVDVCDDIIKNKDKAEPYLGISINERYTPEVLERYGYPVGAVVYSVAGDSPAEKAGIRRNDIITKFNGEGVEKYSDLVDLVKKCEPGDSISVTVYRAGRTLTLTVIIGSNTAG